MSEVFSCPECGSWDTELAHTERYNGEIEDVRHCNECPTEYVLSWGTPIVEDVNIYD